MATNSDPNNPSVQGKGNPSDSGKHGAQIKDNVAQSKFDQHKRDMLADEYTEGVEQPRSDIQTNPNRNTHKVNNQSTSYGAKGKE
jgi:hypothetical protein